MRRLVILPVLAVIYVLVTGFALDNAIVPQAEILSGGPPKDGIPALLEPKFISAEQAEFMQADDQVIGVVISGHPRAYPIKILNWHEVVNDSISDTPIAVTF